MAIILIVEDRPIDRQLLATILRTRGHELVEASDGEEALDALKQIGPDLVISDIGLPGGSGNQLMSALQALSPVKGIALSGYGMKADVDRSEAAGFSAHMTKPCDLSVLNAIIDKVLSGDSSPK